MNRDDVELDRQTTLLEGFVRVDRLQLRHRLFEGGWSAQLEREVMIRGQVAAVIPYDPQRDELVLIEQFRIGPFAAGDAEPWSTEIVAGMVEAGESAAEMAGRETMEETGCMIGRLEKIMEFYSTPGASTQHVTMFIAEVSTQSAGGVYGLVSEGEDIRVFTISPREALEMIDTGVIDNAITIIALQWFALHGSELRRRWLALPD